MKADDRLVVVRRHGAVAIVTLNRPDKLNALSTALEDQLTEAIQGDDVGSASAVVIQGAGRAFSAGADVNEMRNQTPPEIMAHYRTSGEVYERMARVRQPTVAAIHGYCLGGGLELALACDFRVADETAVFGLPEVSIGIVPSSGGLHRLVRAVGPVRAKELILLHERFGVDEARSFGLVTAVVPEGLALARALEMALELSDRPALAVEVTKRAVDAAGESSRDAALLIERLAYAALAQTPEHREATERFTSRIRGTGSDERGHR